MISIQSVDLCVCIFLSRFLFFLFFNQYVCVRVCHTVLVISFCSSIPMTNENDSRDLVITLVQNFFPWEEKMKIIFSCLSIYFSHHLIDLVSLYRSILFLCSRKKKETNTNKCSTIDCIIFFDNERIRWSTMLSLWEIA